MKTIKTLAMGLAVVGLMAATSTRASITPVGDPQLTHSWAQQWTDLESFTYNAVQFVYVAGSTFENPALTGLPSGWSSTYYTSTLTAAAGPGTQNLGFTLNFNGNTTTADFLWIDYNNGVVQATYELFYNSLRSGAFAAGSGWSYNILDSTQAPALVPEPTTMVAGALLLLPFGASTLRILRRRTA